MKKVFVLVLALCMIVTSVPVLAEAQPEGQFVDGVYRYNDTVTLTAIVRYDMANCPDPYNLWFYKWLEEKTNIHIEVIDAVANEQAGTYSNMMFAGGDLPDILLNWPIANRAKLAELGDTNGMLMPLNNYITEELMPNFYPIYEKYHDLIKYEMMTINGNLYGFPRIQEEKQYSVDFAYQTLHVRTDWFEAVGYAELPKTLDEFRDALRKIKEQDPGAVGEALVPLGGAFNGSNCLTNFLNAYGFQTSTNNRYVCSIDGSYMDHDICFYPYHDRYYSFLEYVRSLYAEELLDPDFFTQTGVEVKADKVSNTIAACVSWGMFSYTDAPFVVAPLMTTEECPFKITGMAADAYLENYCFVTSACRNVEAVMHMMDLGYSDAYRACFYYGPEVGKDDTYGLTGGWQWKEGAEGVLREFVDVLNGNYASHIDAAHSVTPFAYTGGMLDMRSYGKELAALNNDDPADRYSIEINRELAPYTVSWYPGALFDEETQNRITDIESVLIDHVNKETAKFITGARELNPEEFAKYREELDAIGYQEYWDLQYQAFLEQYR